MAAIKYFLYSKDQLEFRKLIDKKMGKTFKVGSVFVNGKKKPFTELSSTPVSSRFTDTKVIASGDPDVMRYTMPSS